MKLETSRRLDLDAEELALFGQVGVGVGLDAADGVEGVVVLVVDAGPRHDLALLLRLGPVERRPEELQRLSSVAAGMSKTKKKKLGKTR